MKITKADIICISILTAVSAVIILLRSSISLYPFGNDIYAEYHAFRIFSETWQFPEGHVGHSLSVTLFPSILAWLGLSGPFIFKYIMQIPAILTPAVCYLIYRRFFSIRWSLVSALVLVSTHTFLQLTAQNIRLGFSIFVFALFIMLLVRLPRSLIRQIALIIILGVLITSYYTVATLALIIFVVFVSGNYALRMKRSIRFSPYLLLLGIVIYFAWWWTPFLSNHIPLLIDSITSTSAKSHLTFLTLCNIVMPLGIIAAFATLQKRLGNYAVLMLTTFIISTLIAFFPFTGRVGVSSGRVFYQGMIIYAPAFAICLKWVFSHRYNLKVLRLAIYSICIALATGIVGYDSAQNSKLYDYILGMKDTRPPWSQQSYHYQVYYVHPSEVIAAEWLIKNNQDKLPVYIGNQKYPGYGDVFEFAHNASDMNFNVKGFRYDNHPPEDAYIFLMRTNIENGWVSSIYLPTPKVGLEEFSHYLDGRELIYSDGIVEIWR